MAATAENIADQAIAWHLALAGADSAAWCDFVVWLEADPAHADAYDRLVLADADLAAPIDGVTWIAPPATQVASWVWPKRIAWGGSALAAAAAAWLAILPAAPAGNALYSIETRPGATREILLADGSRIALNGASRITLDRHDPRVATLDRGEAMFDVVHHADRPFELRSGGVVLRDVGTRFAVTRRTAALDVSVAEGSVLFQPDREKVSLTRGMALAMRDGEDRLTLRHVAPEGVGGWRHGVLDFRAVSLGLVAEDISRSTGAPVRVAPALADRPFTGTIRVDRPGDGVVQTLAMLAGGAARRDGRDWVIEPISTGVR